MNAKLIVAVVASLIATSAAQAGQSFGRDSVYAKPGVSASSQPTTTVTPVARFGRDSVYANQTPSRAERRPVATNEVVVLKPGRA